MVGAAFPTVSLPRCNVAGTDAHSSPWDTAPEVAWTHEGHRVRRPELRVSLIWAVNTSGSDVSRRCDLAHAGRSEYLHEGSSFVTRGTDRSATPRPDGQRRGARAGANASSPAPSTSRMPTMPARSVPNR